MEEIEKTLRERINETEKLIEQATTLIAVGKTAGLDTTSYEIQLQDLKAQLERWKKALEQFKKPSSSKK